MDIHSATNAVNEEHLQVEEADDPCKLEYFEIVPLSKETVDSCSSECVSGDSFDEVKQENLAVVQQEPDDVCCIIFDVYFITANGGRGMPEKDMMGCCYEELKFCYDPEGCLLSEQKTLIYGLLVFTPHRNA